MPVISDGFDTYKLRPDGSREYAETTEFELNGEVVYKYDRDTGVLQASMDQPSIDLVVKMKRGFPINELLMPQPLGGVACFRGVKEIRSLPRKDGTYFVSIVPAKKTLWQKLFG